MQRADWLAASSSRYWCLPTTMLEAERLPITVAPASAAKEEGGAGTHRSSQISACSTSCGSSARRNSSSAPNGAFCPASAISARRQGSPGRQQPLERFLGGADQRLLVEQVLAAVGGEPQFGEHGEHRFRARRLAHQLERALQVVRRGAAARRAPRRPSSGGRGPARRGGAPWPPSGCSGWRACRYC